MSPAPRNLAIAAAIFALTLVVFHGVGTYEFLGYDDNLYVTENDVVTGGWSVDGVRWALTTGHAGNWVPVTWLSHMLDVELFGVEAGAHHRVNVVLHAANAVLLFVLFVGMTGDRGPAAFLALAFAIHPLHVESVAWIADRKDLLSALFCFLAMLAYRRYAEKPGAGWYLAVVAWFCLALMSKQTAVVLPFVLLLLDLWPLGRIRGGRADVRRVVLEKLPLAALAVAAIAVAYRVQASAGALKSVEAFPLAGRIANAVVSYAWYVWKTVWPSGLAVPYPYVAPLSAWQVAGAALGLTAITVLALRSARSRPYVTVGWLWFVGGLVPVIGLVQIGTHARADRYAYLPIAGLLIVVVWGVPAWSSSKPWRLVATVAAASVLIAWTAVTLQQLPHWKNTETLSRRALAVTTDNTTAHLNLAVHLGRAGRTDEAIEQYRDVLRIRPDHYKANWNLGNTLFRAGRGSEAAPHFRAVLRSDPDAVQPMTKLAAILAAGSSPASAEADEAVRLAERATVLTDQMEPHVLWVLATAYQAAGRPESARGPACAAWRLAVGRQERGLQAEIERRIGRDPCAP